VIFTAEHAENAEKTREQVMTKRKSTRVRKKEAAPVEKSQEGEKSQLPYTLGKWKGLRQWRCRLCQWDTLVDEAEMLAHIQEKHAPRARQTVTTELPFVDRYGNPIKIETEVEEHG
jgi:hypothetical protein